MNGEQSQAAIARALGLAKSRITAMKKQGMPVHSIEAAQEWRRRHVGPIVRTSTRNAPLRPLNAGPVDLAGMSGPLQGLLGPPASPEAAMQKAIDLVALAVVAIDNGTFKVIETVLRLALSDVPAAYRHRMPALPLRVWDALCSDVFALCDVDMENLDNAPKLSDPEEIESMGAFWYQVAAGEIRPTP